MCMVCSPLAWPFTVPYSVEESMRELPDCINSGSPRWATSGLVNRTRQGEIQVFQDPVFHRA
jgi:hypothetical protein